MKKILFVIQSIGFGGSMTSLINLLEFLKDNQNISIDVLIMDRYGELLGQIKEVAHVLPENRPLQAVSAPRNKLLKLRRFDLLVIRCIYAMIGKIYGETTENVAFKYAAKSFSNYYDCVIAYQESIATNFVSFVKADKKIAWVHNDFENVCKLYNGIDKMNYIYSMFDRIVCVSKASQKNFRAGLNFRSDYIDYIYNTLNEDIIKRKAVVPVEQIISTKNDLYQKLCQNKIFKFVSSGRIVRQKRFDRVIQAAKILKMQGIEFFWFIIGDGQLYSEISEMIANEKLENYVFLTGGLKNPFPIVNYCDAFVLTSDFEAHPMVANEALILGKPVITTSFESAKEVVVDEKNGLICEMTSESIAFACKKLVENKSLFFNLQAEVNHFHYCNDTIIRKVLKLIGE